MKFAEADTEQVLVEVRPDPVYEAFEQLCTAVCISADDYGPAVATLFPSYRVGGVFAGDYIERARSDSAIDWRVVVEIKLPATSVKVSEQC